MSNKLIMLLMCAALISILILSGCKGKSKNPEADSTTPPPLPEEGAAEEQQPPVPPVSPVPPASPDQQRAPGQQPAGLPLIG